MILTKEELITPLWTGVIKAFNSSVVFTNNPTATPEIYPLILKYPKIIIYYI